MAQSRRMPTRSAIMAYWSKQLMRDDADPVRPYKLAVGAKTGWDSPLEFRESLDVCWACGMDWGDGDAAHTERAHITARCNGGADAVENLHLLCPMCHRASESVEGDMYWEWLRLRSFRTMLGV